MAIATVRIAKEYLTLVNRDLTIRTTAQPANIAPMSLVEILPALYSDALKSLPSGVDMPFRAYFGRRELRASPVKPH